MTVIINKIENVRNNKKGKVRNYKWVKKERL